MFTLDESGGRPCGRSLAALVFFASLLGATAPGYAQDDPAPLLAVATSETAQRGRELAGAISAYLTGLQVEVRQIPAGSRGDAVAAAKTAGARAVLWAGANLEGVVLVKLEGGATGATPISVPDAGQGWTARCEIAASKILALTPTILATPDEEESPVTGAPETSKKPRKPAAAPAEEPPPDPEETPPEEPEGDAGTPRDEQPAAAAEPEAPTWAWGIAPRVGAVFPLGELSPFVCAGLQIEIAPPVFGRIFSIAADVSFTRPERREKLEDPLYGELRYVHKVYLTRASVEALLRLPGRHTQFAALIGAGAVLNHILSRQTTSLDDFTATEESIEPGVVGLAAAEARLGQGYAFWEVRYHYSDLDQFLTGDTSTSSIEASLGYRVIF